MRQEGRLQETPVGERGAERWVSRTPGGRTEDLDGDDAEIRVLVVHTAEATAAHGGSDGMQALIDLWLADANAAYAASGVHQRIVLAHVHEVDYSPRDDTLFMDLRGLESPFDGRLDEVHELRDTYEADLVHLIIAEAPGCVCGLAPVMRHNGVDFERLGFGITAASCTGPVFVHELGHNMGLAHDRSEADFKGLYRYSHGYVTPAVGRSTIMARGGAPALQLLRFSNPEQTYGGGTARGSGGSHVVGRRRSGGRPPFPERERDDGGIPPAGLRGI